jgi:hypothetical protein
MGLIKRDVSESSALRFSGSALEGTVALAVTMFWTDGMMALNDVIANRRDLRKVTKRMIQDVHLYWADPQCSISVEDNTSKKARGHPQHPLNGRLKDARLPDMSTRTPLKTIQNQHSGVFTE